MCNHRWLMTRAYQRSSQWPHWRRERESGRLMVRLIRWLRYSYLYDTMLGSLYVRTHSSATRWICWSWWQSNWKHRQTGGGICHASLMECTQTTLMLIYLVIWLFFCVKFQVYLVIELTEATLQVESTRVGEFGKYLQVSNKLSVREKTNPVKT